MTDASKTITLPQTSFAGVNDINWQVIIIDIVVFFQITREVELHKNLRHKHVVGFHSYFEDDENVYIVLEICTRKVSIKL